MAHALMWIVALSVVGFAGYCMVVAGRDAPDGTADVTLETTPKVAFAAAELASSATPDARQIQSAPAPTARVPVPAATAPVPTVTTGTGWPGALRTAH